MDNKRLHLALFQGLNKATYKPDAFFKVSSSSRLTKHRAFWCTCAITSRTSACILRCFRASKWLPASFMPSSRWALLSAQAAQAACLSVLLQHLRRAGLDLAAVPERDVHSA